MGFWKWVSHWPGGSENPILGRWSLDSSWHAAEVHLLRCSPVVNWHRLQMEGGILTDSVFLAFENYKEKSNSVDSGMVCFC